MKNVLAIAIILILSLGQGVAFGQTPIVSSKVKSKDFKEVIWLSNNEITDDKVTIVDFYNDNNPSCVKILNSTLFPLHKKDSTMQIVILALEDTPSLAQIVEQYPDVNVGVDVTGEVYRKFGVKYVPFSIVISSDNRIKWMGMLYQFTPKTQN